MPSARTIVTARSSNSRRSGRRRDRITGLGTVHGHRDLWMFLAHARSRWPSRRRHAESSITTATARRASRATPRTALSSQRDRLSRQSRSISGGVESLTVPHLSSARQDHRSDHRGRRRLVVGLHLGGERHLLRLVMVLVYPLTMAKDRRYGHLSSAALLWVSGIGHIVGGNVDLHATAWLLTARSPAWLISRPLHRCDAGRRASDRASGTILLLRSSGSAAESSRLDLESAAGWIALGTGLACVPACAPGSPAAVLVKAKHSSARGALEPARAFRTASSFCNSRMIPSSEHSSGACDQAVLEARRPDMSFTTRR